MAPVAAATPWFHIPTAFAAASPHHQRGRALDGVQGDAAEARRGDRTDQTDREHPDFGHGTAEFELPDRSSAPARGFFEGRAHCGAGCRQRLCHAGDPAADAAGRAAGVSREERGVRRGMQRHPRRSDRAAARVCDGSAVRAGRAGHRWRRLCRVQPAPRDHEPGARGARAGSQSWQSAGGWNVPAVPVQSSPFRESEHALPRGSPRLHPAQSAARVRLRVHEVGRAAARSSVRRPLIRSSAVRFP
jgi:hypothetical protein